MIALLTGRLAAVGLGEVVIDVAGVGYQVRIPPGMRVGRVGEQTTLHTHLAVREDSLTLYGFAATTDKAVFETLLGVTGVGPKLALAAIGSLGADGLRSAVVAEDVAALTVIPGVGKKGAQRMILELRERLGGMSDGVPGAALSELDARGEVREALASLGYGAAEVSSVLETLPSDQEATAEDLLRAALRGLGAGRTARG